MWDIMRQEYYRKNRDKVLQQQKETRKRKLENDPEWREKQNEYWRKYTRRNYEARLLAVIKSKCKRFNIPFDLTLEDIVIPTHCPKTGIPLVVHEERGKFMDTPSVDRINPKGGYVKGNIQIVCFWYNVAKLNFSDEEVLDLCKKVVEYGTLSAP